MFSNPNFFSILCVAWGSIALLFTFIIFVFGKNASQWLLKSFAPEKRPIWLVILAILYLVLTIYIWYAVTTMGVKNSWIIAVFFSFGIVKNYLILFDYKGYCNMCYIFFEKPSTVALFNILVSVFSALLVFMGLFYYNE